MVRALAVLTMLASTAATAGVDWVVNNSDTGFDPIAAGGNVTYVVVVSNNGNSAAPPTTLALNVPATTSFVSASGMSCSGAGPVTCSVPALSAAGGGSDSATVNVTIRTSAQGEVTLGASVPTAGDDDIANNADNESTTVNAGANLALVLAGPSSAQSGGSATYTFTVTNNGPDASGTQSLSFPVPSGLVGVSPPSGCTLAGSTYSCAVAGLANGASTTLAFSGQIAAAGGSTLTPSGSIAAMGGPADPVMANNSALFNTTVTAGSNLRLQKSRAPAGTLLVGQSVNFTLTPTYTGDWPSGLTISDTLPSNYTVGTVASLQNGWACSVAGQTVTCTKAAGSGGGNAVSLGNIVIPATAASAGSGVVNTASISATGPSDPDLANNTASDTAATIQTPTVELRANKSGPNPALAVTGQTFSWSISATNLGNAGFVGTLTMTDSLPAGVTVASYALNGWSCTPAAPVAGAASIVCSRVFTSGAPLAAGATTTAVVLNTSAASAGAYANSMTVNSPDANIADTTPGNDTAGHTVTVSDPVNSADLSVLKRVSPASLAAGDVLTYEMEIVNAGPATATTVTLSDTLGSLINNSVGPTGAGYVGESVAAGVATGASCASASAGAVSRTLTCSIASLPVCTAGVDCPVVTVQVRPGGNGGSRSNTASVVSQDSADPDSADRTASVTSTIDPRADVAVSKTVTPAAVPAGQNLTYVVTASNVANGLSAAAAVTITDTLPNNVTFISAMPSSGSCATTPAAGSTSGPGNNQVICNLGTLNNGAQQTVAIVVRPNTVTRGNTLTNTVTVGTSTTEANLAGTDPSLNNSASVNASVQNPVLDLLVNKVDSVDPVAAGDNTVYTLTMTNNGPSAAENVVVTDTLPATRLTYQSHTVPVGGACSSVPAVGSTGGTLTCSVPVLAAGQSRSFTVTLQGIGKGVDTNTASVVSDESLAGFDANLANNSVSETTTVRTKADMQVVNKIAAPNPVNLRDNFNFVIKVRNNPGVGLAEADNVVVSDSLPAGMVLTGTPTVALVAGTVTATTCGGTAGSTSFTCSLGTVSSGGEVDITVPVEVVSVMANPQTMTNTATVLSSSLDVNGGNNYNSGGVTVNASSIAGRVFRDFNNDGLVTAGDTGIAGVTMTLTGTSFDGAPISRTAVTDASGNFSFPLLPQGTYSVSEGFVSETPLNDGLETAGTAGGNISVNDIISGIGLPGNTAATGYLFAEVPVPRVGVAKSASGVVNNGDGTYSVVFTLRVSNAGTTSLSSVQVTDVLAGALPQFGTYTASAVPAAGQYAISSGPTVSAQANGAALTAVAAGAYTGTGAGTGLLVAASSSLPNTGASASSAQIAFTVRFFPTMQGPFENRAVAAGTSPVGAIVTDDSVDGTGPDANNNGDPTDDSSPTVVNLAGQAIGVAKRVTGVVQMGTKRFRVPYSLVVQNVSSMTTATNVQVRDDLVATFPTAVSRTIVAAPAVSACTGTVLNANPAYTGSDANTLLLGNQNLQANEACTITFAVEIDFGSNPLPTAVQNNQAQATTHQTPGGTLIATDLSDDGTVPDGNGNGNASEGGENDPTPVSFAAASLSSVTGTVYLDVNHNRVNDDGAPATAQVQGFIVEALNSAGTVVGSAVTDASGNYTVSGLFPSTSGNPATYYSLRFREPVSGVIYGLPQSTDPTPARNGAISNGVVTGLQLAPGVMTLQQNLPLDPSGVVYDSITRTSIAGAQATLLNSGVAVPGSCLVGGANTQTTGPSGMYQFLLLNPAPLGCPGSGTYTLQVVQPGSYLPPDSTIIPPTAGPYVPSNGGTDPIQVQPGAPAGANPTVYYTSFALTLTGVPGTSSSNVVNNHIPLDPILGGAIALTKITPLVNVSVGQLVPYTIIARNTLAANLTNIDIRDTMPPGFKYMRGSATVDGVPLEPAINGRELDWANLTLAANTTRTIKLLLVVGAGVQPGEYVNSAQAFNNLAGVAVSSVATATVRVIPDAVFDCSDLIGKVFDDKNANGYQDDGEPGIANVRLASARGWLVTTDAEGRFHVACAAIPDADRGSNFIMKLDERTLPVGYRVTTENPRDVRLTRGKLTKLNFGATIHKVVRVDMSDAAFEPGKTTLKPDWAKQLATLPDKLKARPFVLRLGYKAGADGEALVRERLQTVSQELKDAWKQKACCHTLLIEEELFLPAAKAKKEGK